jgi:environmental stress-induced protein Ves
MDIIRAAALQPRPWPNGLGTTREVASGPGWQIGIADLAGEAAFSHFPHADRIFTLIAGDGATLTLAEGPLPCRLWVPAGFPGDVPSHYRPLGGPARAFNVIADRRSFAARVTVHGIAPSHAVRGAGLAVFCAEGVLELAGERLEAGDTALHPGGAAVRAVGGSALAILVEMQAR